LAYNAVITNVIPADIGQFCKLEATEFRLRCRKCGFGVVSVTVVTERLEAETYTTIIN